MDDSKLEEWTSLLSSIELEEVECSAWASWTVYEVLGGWILPQHSGTHGQQQLQTWFKNSRSFRLFSLVFCRE